MPRKYSRILLEVVNIRVERLQKITEEDAKAEGCDNWIPCGVCTGLKGVRIGGAKLEATYKEYFELLWDSINLKRGYDWDKNPWVWVIEFKVIESE